MKTTNKSHRNISAIFLVKKYINCNVNNCNQLLMIYINNKKYKNY